MFSKRCFASIFFFSFQTVLQVFLGLQLNAMIGDAAICRRLVVFNGCVKYEFVMISAITLYERLNMLSDGFLIHSQLRSKTFLTRLYWFAFKMQWLGFQKVLKAALVKRFLSIFMYYTTNSYHNFANGFKTII